MDKLLNLLKNPKERQDFFIALIVIALFGYGILYAIFPSTSQIETDLAEEVIVSPLDLEQRLENSLKNRNLGIEKGIITDLKYPEDFEIEGEGVDEETDSITKFSLIGKNKLRPTRIVDNNQDANTPTTEAEVTHTEAELYEEESPLKEEKVDESKQEIGEEKNAITEEAVDNREEAGEKANTEKAISQTEEGKNATINRAELEQSNKTEATSPAEDKTTNTQKITEKEKSSDSEKISEDNSTTTNELKTNKNRTADKKKAASSSKKQTTTVAKPKPKPKTPPSDYTAPDKQRITTQKASACVVVVGAFKNAEGATALENQLKAANYTTTTGFSNRLKYVGIPVDCKDEAAITRIRAEVDQKFDVSSWVLWKW